MLSTNATSSLITTYTILSCSKLDQDSTLEWSFFDFPSSYLMFNYHCVTVA